MLNSILKGLRDFSEKTKQKATLDYSKMLYFVFFLFVLDIKRDLYSRLTEYNEKYGKKCEIIAVLCDGKVKRCFEDDFTYFFFK